MPRVRGERNIQLGILGDSVRGNGLMACQLLGTCRTRLRWRWEGVGEYFARGK